MIIQVMYLFEKEKRKVRVRCSLEHMRSWDLSNTPNRSDESERQDV